MHVDLKIIGFLPEPSVREYISRRLQFALGRFDRHVRRVIVHLTDVNGPRGGPDKRCRMIAEFHHGGEATVADTRPNALEAIYFAAARLRHQVGKRLASARTKPRLRQNRKPDLDAIA
jgi:hypothetical protein